MSNPTFHEVLRCEIEKRKLNDLAMKYGLADRRVIAQSQKVDRLVNALQRRKLA